MEDKLIRATGADGQIRIFAGVTTNLVEEARQRHITSPVATAALGRTLTGVALMGMTLKEGQTVSLQFLGDGPLGSIMAVSNHRLEVRGYVQHPEVELDLNSRGKLDVSRGVGKGMLYVVKDLGLKEPYTGSTPITTGEIGEDLTMYFAKSEQTPSAVGLGVLVDVDFTVKSAGGFILQLLPQADEALVKSLESNLAKLESGVTGFLRQGKDAADLIDFVLDGVDYKITDEQDIRFKCTCNRERLERVVVNLGEEEARDILEKEGQLELTCHFCNDKYHFTAEDLDRLFVDS